MIRSVFFAIAFTFLFCVNGRADTIEFLSGAKVEGVVKQIRKEKKELDFEVSIGGRTLNRTYPYDKIHAVTMQGKRYVLNEDTGEPAGRAPANSAGASDDADSTASDGTARRTKAQIDALVDQQGRTPPDWFDATPLEYPQSLDLDWPEPAPKPWNNQKNVGQYVWDIINPNPGRWRSGVRFMHHLLEKHKDDPQSRERVMKSLASMYFRFFQDYPRAAFWWRLAGVSKTDPDALGLAECYWRLGNKQMAVQLVDTKTLRLNMIKFYGDIGDTRKALELAEVFVKHNQAPHAALLYAGDACRLAGQSQQAMRYYQQVVDRPATGQYQKRDENFQRRAAASLEAIKLFELSDVSKVEDGTYRAQSLGYSGDVHIEVAVRYHRIESVKVTDHKEEQFYSALTDTPNQIIAKQGVKGVDATSRATITAEAIINATAKALASGAKQ